MEIRQLRYFVGVVEAGSFTKAATHLNVAQSALSLHVRQLEEGFGTQLLTRERTGIRMTASGVKLLKHAQTILREIQLTEAELTSRTASPAGEVTIGITSGIARAINCELLAMAKEALPRVSLKVVEAMTGPLEEMIDGGRLNLAVLYRAAESSKPATVLAREHTCLIVPPKRPPYEDTIRLKDLQAYPLAVVIRKNDVRWSAADFIAEHGCALDVRFEVDSLSTIISLVTEGKVYSILLPSAVQKEIKQRQLRAVKIIDPAIERHIVIEVNPKDEGAAAISAVRKLVAKVIKKQIEQGEMARSIFF
ncbi:LysR family transcriptional regulator [Bradyrhizobium sp. USDA 3315]